MRKIVVVGSISIDNTVYTKVMPSPGTTSIADSYISNVGGKGANQACAALFLGADVTFIGAVGKDDNGNRVRSFLKENKLDARLKESNEPTGVAFITINKENAENQILIVTGANEDLAKEDIDKNEDLFVKDNILLLQFENDMKTVEYAIRKGKETGMFVVVNPAPYKELSKELYQFIDILVPNEHELELLSHKDNLKEGIEELHYRGAKNIIATLGENGSLYDGEHGSFRISPHKVDAIDTTAAGDSYLGALVYKLSIDSSIKNAMEYASYCSSLTVSKKGAIIALPHKSDINL